MVAYSLTRTLAPWRESAERTPDVASSSEPKDEPAEPAVRDAGDELGKKLGTFVDGGYVRVYRVTGGKRALLENFYPDDGVDILEAIQQRWGGGDFYLQPCKPGGNMAKGGGAVSIEGAPKRRHVVAHELEQPAPALDVDEMLERLRDMLAEVRHPPPAASESGDAIKMAVALVTAVQAATQPLVEALLNRPEPAASPGKELLQAFTAGMKVMNRTQSGSDRPTHWDRMIDSVLVPLIEKMDATNQQPAGGAAAPPVRELAPGEAPTSWPELVAGFVPKLAPYAREGRSPELYAQLILEEVPDVTMLDPLLDAIEAGRFYDEFFERFPLARQDPGWWRELTGKLWYHARGPEGDDDGDDAGAGDELAVS